MANVIFTGVGGQGVILASKILMEVAKEAGYDVKESEVHGMAQRGGSVECHVRFDDKVYSPLIAKSTADYIVTFEMLETMRKLEYLSDNGTIIVNKQRIDPAPVQTGEKKYPEDIESWISSNVKNYKFVDTEAALKEAGSKKALNIVMLGILSTYLSFDLPQWEAAIKSTVKEKFVEMNLRAFSLGRSL